MNGTSLCKYLPWPHHNYITTQWNIRDFRATCYALPHLILVRSSEVRGFMQYKGYTSTVVHVTFLNINLYKINKKFHTVTMAMWSFKNSCQWWLSHPAAVEHLETCSSVSVSLLRFLASVIVSFFVASNIQAVDFFRIFIAWLHRRVLGCILILVAKGAFQI